MYAGRVAFCHMANHSEYADETDRQTNERTPDRYNISASEVTTIWRYTNVYIIIILLLIPFPLRFRSGQCNEID